MSKYKTHRVKILTTGKVVEELAKDGIDAREQVADMFDVSFDKTELV